MKYTLLTTLACVALMFSCKGESKATKAPAAKVKLSSNKEYAFRSIESFTFTAFKTSKKLGVKGSFDSIAVDATKADASTDMIAATKGIMGIVDITSLNTQNSDRDAKIKKAFFGTYNLKDIKVTIAQIDAAKGSAILEIGLNNISKMVDFKVTKANSQVTFKTTINVADFKMQEGLGALNKVCEDLHRGDDGKSILWPDVELELVLNM